MATIPLKELRNRDGITQADLSAMLNVSPSTVGMWEQGRREPDFHYLTRIADIFNVSTDYLLGRSVANYQDKLSIEQIRLLEGYESLGMDGRNLLQEVLASLCVTHAREKPNYVMTI